MKENITNKQLLTFQLTYNPTEHEMRTKVSTRFVCERMTDATVAVDNNAVPESYNLVF